MGGEGDRKFHSHCFINWVHIVYLDMLVVTGKRKIRRLREICKLTFNKRKLVRQSAVIEISQLEQITEKNPLQQFIQSSMGGAIFLVVNTISLDIHYFYQKLSWFFHTNSQRNALP